jgi:hypothetical protein
MDVADAHAEIIVRGRQAFRADARDGAAPGDDLADRREARLGRREAFVVELLARAELRDRRAEDRDRRAEERDRLAHRRRFPTAEEERAAAALDRALADSDRYAAGVDRDLSAGDRADLLAQQMQPEVQE